MTQGTAMVILVSSFEAKERAKMLGLQIGAVGLGQIVGPSLGGVLTGTIGWRALFAITAAAMLAIAVTSQRTLRRRANRPKVVQPFDYGGALAFSSFLVSAAADPHARPRHGLARARDASPGPAPRCYCSCCSSRSSAAARRR